jgi:glutamate mutase epsilon subunit
MRHPAPTLTGEDVRTALVYELLDAHDDTAALAEELAGDPRWDAHLDYLRALQRVGRATLARIAQDASATAGSPEDHR